MRFDAHQHFWHPARLHYPILKPDVFGDLYRTVEPSELEPLLQEAGIAGTVVVQAKDGLDETDYLLELADACDWIAGVVGWVELADPEAASRQLAQYAPHPKFKGVRHLIMMDGTDPDWLIRPEVLEGLGVLADFGLPFDVGADFPRHLRHVPAIAEAVPRLRMVIDHLGKPPAVKSDAFGQWSNELRAAASYPQVYAKLSGFDPAEDCRPAFETAIDAFGASRLMFGSDWPIAEFRGGYAAALRTVESLCAERGCAAAEQAAVFGGTARAFYRLGEAVRS